MTIKPLTGKVILEKARGKGLPINEGPVGWKAAASYLASKYSKEPVSLREVADKFNVTQITVLIKFRELISALRL